MKSCSFFGHRDVVITKNLKDKLKEIIENLIINENCYTFYFGEMGDFDNLCYEIVSEFKKFYPTINRIYVCTDEKTLFKRKRKNLKKYEQETVLTLDFSWWYTIIYYRNLAIIDNSDFVIFYVLNKENSGANKAMNYAIKTKKKYINVAELI